MNLGLGKIVYEGYNSFPQKGLLQFEELNHESIKAWNIGAMSLINALIKNSPKSELELKMELKNFASNAQKLEIEELIKILTITDSAIDDKLLVVFSEKGYLKNLKQLTSFMFILSNLENITTLLRRFLITKAFQNAKNDEEIANSIKDFLNSRLISESDIIDFISKLQSVDQKIVKAFVIDLSKVKF